MVAGCALVAALVALALAWRAREVPQGSVGRGCQTPASRNNAPVACHRPIQRPYLQDTIFASKGRGRGMSQIEKIIVVVLGIISVSLLGFIIHTWTSQRTPAVAAPGPAVTAAQAAAPKSAAAQSQPEHRQPPAVVQAQPTTQPPVIVQSKPDNDVLTRAQSATRDILKDPDSAQFSGLVALQNGMDTVVCGFVNAKNGYGGYSGRQGFIYSDGIRSSHMNKYDGQILEACRNIAAGRYVRSLANGFQLSRW
jgi:hypothetical protein